MILERLDSEAHVDMALSWNPLFATKRNIVFKYIVANSYIDIGNASNIAHVGEDHFLVGSVQFRDIDTAFQITKEHALVLQVQGDANTLV